MESPIFNMALLCGGEILQGSRKAKDVYPAEHFLHF